MLMEDFAEGCRLGPPLETLLVGSLSLVISTYLSSGGVGGSIDLMLYLCLFMDSVHMM